MEKSTTWLKEVALLHTETLSVPEQSMTSPRQRKRQSSSTICAATPVLFIKPLRVGMLAMLVDDDSPDMVMVALMVPLIETLVLAVIDALAASGFITFSYVEQFALGAVWQLS